MLDIELGWLAGIFDGEGTIVLAQRQRPGGGSLRIQIPNTARSMLDKVQEITGVGLIHCKKHDNPRWSDCYVWTVSGAVAVELLRRMRPWLFSKAERADLAISGQTFPRKPWWSHRYGEEDVTAG